MPAWGRFLQLPLIVVCFLTTMIVDDWTLSLSAVETAQFRRCLEHYSAAFILHKADFFLNLSVPDVISCGCQSRRNHRGWDFLFLFSDRWGNVRVFKELKHWFLLFFCIYRLCLECRVCVGLWLIYPVVLNVSLHVRTAIGT